jgi:hypothetical protein
MSLSKSILERALPFRTSTSRPAIERLLKGIDDALDIAGKVEASAADVRNNQHLSDIGKKSKLREGTPARMQQIKSIKGQIDAAQREIAAEKGKFKLAAPPTDPVSLQLRGEIRAYIRDLDNSKRLEMVRNADQRTLEAILEAPAFLSGLPEQVVASVQESLIAKQFGPQLAAMADDDELLSLAHQATEAAYAAVNRAGGYEGQEFLHLRNSAEAA